ncbi:MAG: NifB/NifX family molybdenum-iron cluster-binding protein [Candidatus Aenigmarchaeota archaeon]|nr:NifB/NifX family molybdenum-iron cluster-binding protein [Candidatus Aenigmarchaeota archaeon]
MKIAISSAGRGLDSQMSGIFGRCPYFVIVEIENKKIKSVMSIANRAVTRAGGAGIMAAQTVANQNVKAVISGAVGPRAFDVLRQIGIEIYHGVAGTVEDNVKGFMSGKLAKITLPGAMGFGGRGMGRGLGRGRRF